MQIDASILYDCDDNKWAILLAKWGEGGGGGGGDYCTAPPPHQPKPNTNHNPKANPVIVALAPLPLNLPCELVDLQLGKVKFWSSKLHSYDLITSFTIFVDRILLKLELGLI